MPKPTLFASAVFRDYYPGALLATLGFNADRHGRQSRNLVLVMMVAVVVTVIIIVILQVLLGLYSLLSRVASGCCFFRPLLVRPQKWRCGAIATSAFRMR